MARPSACQMLGRVESCIFVLGRYGRDPSATAGALVAGRIHRLLLLFSHPRTVLGMWCLLQNKWSSHVHFGGKNITKKSPSFLPPSSALGLRVPCQILRRTTSQHITRPDTFTGQINLKSPMSKKSSEIKSCYGTMASSSAPTVESPNIVDT